MTHNENIFIHVGYPKSASTTLQKHLFSKHNQLENLGVYPTKNIGNDSKEVNFSVPYLQDEELRKFYQNLSELDDIEYFYSKNKSLLSSLAKRYMRENDKSIVFSDERLMSVFFSHCDNGAKARRLAELFPNAKIIFMIRNQYDWMRSQYRDHPFDPRNLSTGKYMSFDKWFNVIHWNKGIKLLHMLDYYSVIKFYESIFGKENIGVFVFEEMASDLDLFTKKISKYMGIDKDEAFSVMYKKYENSGVSFRYNSYRALKRNYLPAYVSTLIEKYLLSFIMKGEKKKYSLSERNIALLNKFYSEGNLKLINEYGLDLAGYKYPGVGND